MYIYIYIHIYISYMSIYIYIFFFFSIWVFFHEHSRITGLQGKGECISLTPRCNFHPLHKHLDISLPIFAERLRLPLLIANQQQDSNREALVFERMYIYTYPCIFIFICTFICSFICIFLHKDVHVHSHINTGITKRSFN